MASLADALLGQRAQPEGAIPLASLASVPTWADAADWHGQNLRDTWQAMQQPQTWMDAARQYGNAMLMGTTAPGGRMMDNPAFVKWFGGSKIIDASGEPAIAYHGTADNIREFQQDHPNAKDSGWLGRGFYFWNEPKLAGDYATMKAGDAPNVIPAYLKLENPYVATLADKERLMLASRRDPEASANFTADLQSKGHDGVILNYPHQPGLQEIMVFQPEQIKSAISNRGTYAPTDPRITYGIAGLTAGGAAAATQGNNQ